MIEAAIKDPPAIYLRKIPEMTDVKALLNDHRLLHAWMAELTSASPRTVLGNGWTPALIRAAHDAVVKRIKALKPDFDHTSPLTAGKTFTLDQPLLIVPDYVSIVGSSLEGKDSDLDIVVRDDRPNESLDIRLAQALGKDIHVIYNPQGPHDEEYKPLYHLALIPIPLWNAIKTGTSPVVIGLEQYRLSLGGALTMPEYQSRIIIGAGLLRKQLRTATPLEAVIQASEMATKVLSDDPLDFQVELSGASLPRNMFEEALRIYVNLMMPVEDIEAYGKGIEEIKTKIDKWEKDPPFKDSREALDAARELGAAVARKYSGKHESA